LWLNKLIVKAFIEEKIWQKHRVKRNEIEEVLAHRRAIRLRHKKNPVRVVILGPTQTRRLLKIILQFQGEGRYFLVTALDLTNKERMQYGKKITRHS
jgi:ribulose bisphosphate carboxylase small subunit